MVVKQYCIFNIFIKIRLDKGVAEIGRREGESKRYVY